MCESLNVSMWVFQPQCVKCSPNSREAGEEWIRVMVMAAVSI